MNDTDVVKIIDSVDIFLSNERYLMVYYMNTRQRKSFKVNDDVIYLIEQIDGIKTLGEIKSVMLTDRNIEEDEVNSVIELLKNNNMIAKLSKHHVIERDERVRYTRQINYFTEFLGDEIKGERAQKKLFEARVLIFGCGAVGGDIAVELVMSGIRHITLFDMDIVAASDVSRHIFFDRKTIGKSKSDALKTYLEQIDHKAVITTIRQYLHPEDDIEELISSHDFVINTMDEPYIGYTSSKISRICVKHKIPHYIAGGFDAHLASTGELIIPYITPCVECYAGYFKKSLAGWKPKKHPVKERYNEIGGLAAMSLFSASYASIEIIKLIAGLQDMDQSFKVRGELLFDDFSLTYINVEKNPDCPICGKESKL